jgi:hypothetical protein
MHYVLRISGQLVADVGTHRWEVQSVGEIDLAVAKLQVVVVDGSSSLYFSGKGG